MDADRYARIRDLFLEAEDLPSDRRVDFVREKCGDDSALADEVLSLLAEHDEDHARAEGDRAIQVVPALTGGVPLKNRATKADSTIRGHRPEASDDGDITQVGAQRTQASPRYQDGPATRAQALKPLPPPKTILWSQPTRRARRQNSWLFLIAAVLPTSLVGWLTYRHVTHLLREEVRSDVEGLADSLARSTDRFLQTQVGLVQSWSRERQLRGAIDKLVEIGRGENPAETLRAAPEAEVVMKQLAYLSGREDIKFVVWDRTGNTIASWLPDRADVGHPIVHDGASGLAKVFRDETILFGPARLSETTEGFVPETARPVMAPIVPIHNDDGRVIAAMLVRGFGMFESFNGVFGDTAKASRVDVYAVNEQGVMVSESPVAVEAARLDELRIDPNQIGAMLRISEPATDDADELSDRSVLPLTYSAARASRGKNGVRTEPYPNYFGDEVIGAWRWLDRWHLGIVVENDADQAFAAANVVRFGFLSLASLLAVTAVVAASRIARRSAINEAMLHPLSRYEIMGEIGSGGMGVVYRAHHRQLGRDTALKILRGDRRHREDQLRFDREAKLAAAISSPHCVKIYDYGSSPEGESYCVMEYL